MRHLPRSRSKTFRIVLAMAVLAWAALALGAPRMPVSVGAAHAQMSAVDISMHCTDKLRAHANTHHSTPAVTGGQGDCCHHGCCHCLSACSVALLVPFAGAGGMPEVERVRVPINVVMVTVSVAPPLRPPIA